VKAASRRKQSSWGFQPQAVTGGILPPEIPRLMVRNPRHGHPESVKTVHHARTVLAAIMTA